MDNVQLALYFRGLVSIRGFLSDRPLNALKKFKKKIPLYVSAVQSLHTFGITRTLISHRSSEGQGRLHLGLEPMVVPW